MNLPEELRSSVSMVKKPLSTTVLKVFSELEASMISLSEKSELEVSVMILFKKLRSTTAKSM
jgi:hypothetical protein